MPFNKKNCFEHGTWKKRFLYNLLCKCVMLGNVNNFVSQPSDSSKFVDLGLSASTVTVTMLVHVSGNEVFLLVGT